MKSEPSEAAVAEFQGFLDNAFTPFIARQLWGRLRTEEQSKLGGTYQEAIIRHQGTIGWWRVLYPDVSAEQAVLDINKALGAIDESTYEWLMREIVPKRSHQSRKPHPVWNRDRGELSLEGEIIRRIRRGVGKNITRILDAFEEDGWPAKIDSPIATSTAGMKHRDAIRKLNRGLRAIRFRSNGTGDGVLWEMLPQSTV